ncbi:MAG: sulfite exporter TauE/SafE family protein [Candidatus Marsarchaeota archaeon]|nr:sulfite exporter TauE/SafE family protein [Candidatus Marsarchaeota archaeon]MCL5412789.1 sulfite exporter TauE/SafE family protein [Candidatus Marsarchaeota archaeon]
MFEVYLAFLLLTGIVAGIVGSLSGLGGAVVIIPVLTLLLGVPIEYAAGTALIATIANSSGAASAYVKSRLSNIKIGMSLEIATTGGAIIGALIASAIYAKGLSSDIFIIFGIVLFISIIPIFMEHKKGRKRRMNKDWTTGAFQLSGKYYDRAINETVRYSGFRWWFGELVMAAAGLISGLLGIGSGTLKVLAMDWGMGLPIKVTTATSNFMIGVTAAASAAIYWSLGYVQPLLCAPIIIGILAGSYYGSKKLDDIRGSRVQVLFLVILAIAGMEMILRGFGIA